MSQHAAQGGLSPEQLLVRRGGIGGSDIAAVLGLNNYAAQIDVWEDKTGCRITEREDISLNDAVLLGNLFERPILQWYAVKHECALEVPGTLIHSEHPLVRATPDAVARTLDPPRVVEVKRPHRTAHHWGEPGTDEIDECYYPQTMWEMAVTDLRHTDVVAMRGRIPDIYHVEFDAEMFETMRQIAEEWWDKYVKTCTPPPVDGSDSYLAYLKALYPQHVPGQRRETTPEMAPWLGQLKEARRLAKKATEMEQEARNHIIEFIGDAEGCEGDWGEITWKRTRDGAKVDYKRLLDHLQVPADVLAQFTEPRKGHRRFLPAFNEE